MLLNQHKLHYRSEDNILSEVKAELTTLVEHHSHKFAAFAVVCPLYKENINNLKVHREQAVAIQYMSNSLSHTSPTFIPIR